MSRYGKSPVAWLGTPTEEIVPPPRTQAMAVPMLSRRPTASIELSTPKPPVACLIASTGSVCVALIGIAPRPCASSRRLSTMSTTKTRAGPNRWADMIDINPTGPAPITATVSPADISARSAAKKPVARMSPTKIACSSPTPAVVTVTARAEERGHHPIASLEASHLGSRVLDDAHELMAEHAALASWNSPVVDVQVGAADGAQSHLDQRFRRLADRRLGDIDDPHVGFARVSQSPHGRDSMPPLSLSPHATQGGCGGGDRRFERHRRGDGAGLRAPRITARAWRQAPGSLECSCAEMPRETSAPRDHPPARRGAPPRRNRVHNLSAPRPRAHRHPRQQRRSWVDGQVARDARGEGRRAGRHEPGRSHRHDAGRA